MIKYFLRDKSGASSEAKSLAAYGRAIRRRRDKVYFHIHFNSAYTSSVFVSQDPVSIDFVRADFLTNEPSVIQNNGAAGNSGNENYLHEHWNNAADKQYSRNLGKKEGVELIRIE